MKIKKGKKHKQSKNLIVKGVFPQNYASGKCKREYTFWASEYLEKQMPCPGDIVVCITHRRAYKDKTKICQIYQTLYLTDVFEYEDGMFVPTSIATALYKGKKHKDFELEIN